MKLYYILTTWQYLVSYMLVGLSRPNVHLVALHYFHQFIPSSQLFDPQDDPLRLFSLPKYFSHYFLHLLTLSFYQKMLKEKVLHRFFFILKLRSQKLSSDALFYLKQVHFLICKVPRCMKSLLFIAYPSHINSALLGFVVIFMILFLFAGLIF